MRLATAHLCQLRWSDEVQAEWQRHVVVNVRASPQALKRTQTLMEDALPKARVSGYEYRIDALVLPDAGDRHVLAATLEAGARQILTNNLKDFPLSSLAPLGIEAIHPDAWLCRLYEQSPQEFTKVFWALLNSLKRPAVSLPELIVTYQRINPIGFSGHACGNPLRFVLMGLPAPKCLAAWVPRLRRKGGISAQALSSVPTRSLTRFSFRLAVLRTAWAIHPRVKPWAFRPYPFL